ncbi:MAG TPA: hypothetical protein VEA18_00450 [Candidatus Kapabacteria bacterium]|nr:hypothetical protein [Candidatus Kapabacteria bacterium]
MKVPLYRETFGYAWRLAWQHKLLWLFGLFAAMLGQFGILELLSNVYMASSDYALYPNWLALPKLFHIVSFSSFGLPLAEWFWLGWVLVVLLGIALLMAFVSVVSQGALIASAAQYDKRKTLPDVGKAWHIGVSHFWRLLFINLFRKVVLGFLAVLVGFGALNAVVMETTHGMDLFLFFVVFIVAALIGMVVSFIAVYAAAYVVVEEYPLLDALEAAWRLFLDHWLVSLEVGLIVLFMNVLVSVVALGGMMLFMLTLFLWKIMALIATPSVLIVGLLSVSILAGIFFLMALGSIFTVYTTTIWTHLFMKMHKHGLISKLAHWMK